MTWDGRFIKLAEHVAGWSKDPSTQVGAVVVDSKRRVLGLGYNGFPRGVDDSPEMYANREAKYARVVHAEVNAILNATGSVEGATLYIWPLFSCNECAKVVIQAGIARVVSPSTLGSQVMRHEIAGEMYRQAGVHMDEYHA